MHAGAPLQLNASLVEDLRALHPILKPYEEQWRKATRGDGGSGVGPVWGRPPLADKQVALRVWPRRAKANAEELAEEKERRGGRGSKAHLSDHCLKPQVTRRGRFEALKRQNIEVDTVDYRFHDD